MLDVLRKHGFFANFKTCHFHKDKIYFLGYIALVSRIKMEDNMIEVVRNWLESKLVRDIQVFLSFTNFYHHFI